MNRVRAHTRGGGRGRGHGAAEAATQPPARAAPAPSARGAAVLQLLAMERPSQTPSVRPDRGNVTGGCGGGACAGGCAGGGGGRATLPVDQLRVPGASACSRCSVRPTPLPCKHCKTVTQQQDCQFEKEGLIRRTHSCQARVAAEDDEAVEAAAAA